MHCGAPDGITVCVVMIAHHRNVNGLMAVIEHYVFNFSDLQFIATTKI